MSQHQFILREQAQLPLFVGVDLGRRTRVSRSGVVDDLGRPLSWLSLQTDALNGDPTTEAAGRMGAAVERAIDREQRAKRDQVARVGLGSPGTMDIRAGMLLDPPNLPGWTDFPDPCPTCRAVLRLARHAARQT